MFCSDMDVAPSCYTLDTEYSSRMAVLFFVGILSLVVNVIGQQTEYNCHQRPPMTPDIKNCCKRPTLNLDKYKRLCFNSSSTGRKADEKHAFMNPCGIECMYTQAGALSNNVFNIPKLNAFLNEVMPNDPDLARIISVGFQNCGSETQKKMQEFETNRPVNAQGQPVQYQGPVCSPFAVLSTFCALRYSFVNCPANLWTNSDTCNKAQEFIKNCDPMKFGGPRHRGRKRRGAILPTSGV